MKTMRLFGAALILLLVAGAGFAEYDRDTVVGVMQGNLKLIRQVDTDAKNGDFYAAATALMDFARGMMKIQPYTPLRGEKASWDDVMDDFIKATFRGIGACGTEDRDALLVAVGELKQLMQEGHSLFR